MFLYAWYADVPDPDNFLFKLFHSQSSRNFFGYVNPVVDGLLFRARAEQDPLQRVELYRRAEELILDDAPMLPIWHLHLRAAVPVLRPVRRGERAGRPLHPAAEDLAGEAPVSRERLVSLQSKFIAATVLVIALTMAGLIAIVEHRQRAAIIEEVQRRGMVLVQSLAAVSSGPLLLYNFTALEQNVVRFGAESDVAYAMVLDAEGLVAATSLDAAQVGSAPDDPVSARAAAAVIPLLQETRLAGTGESIYDVAVPIVIQGQKWGTARVGLSKRRMEARISATRRELAVLAGLTLLVGGLAAALVARRIARPVRQLADGVAAISRGDLDQRIEAVTSDEIGRLALSFNHMASELRQQRAALTAAHGELERRFAELSDLKSYTDHILASLANGIVTFDLTGRVVTLNAAAEALTGCRLADVGGRHCDEVFSHLPELSRQFARALSTGTGGPRSRPRWAGRTRRPSRSSWPPRRSAGPRARTSASWPCCAT